MGNALQVSAALVALQTGIYLILLGSCIYKLKVAFVIQNSFLIGFLFVALFYIIVELAIQILQLVYLTIDFYPGQISNLVIALNMYCMIADMHLLLLLTLFWKQIEGSFADSFSYVEAQTGKCIPTRLFLPLSWFICYTPYFVYLLITQDMLKPNVLSEMNRIFLYIVCQLICQVLLLICEVWQSYHWCKLQQTMETFERIVPVTMNKNRFKSIFLTTTVFNSIRILFIMFLIVEAYAGSYTNLIIGMNCFTFTAVLPIAFYLFGLKIAEQQQTQKSQKLVRQSGQPQRRTSSAHETQLTTSRQSQNSKLQD